MPPVSRDLARFASAISFEEFDSSVVEMAIDLVIDTVGCSLGAVDSPPVAALRDAYTGERSHGAATVVGTNRTAPVEYAALVNATMSRYLDYNDCYMANSAACHPSDHIMALLAVAEAEGSTGPELLEAIVTAYEVEGRGLDDCPVRTNGFDYAAWGAYSSVASAGKLMGLREDDLVNAFGIVGASNAPLYISRRGDVSMWKGVAHPYISHNAIQACQMARHGMTGPEKVFEGPFGFFEVVSDGEISFDGPPSPDDYRILETSIKSFACGYYIHSPVTGVLQLLDDEAIDPETIDGIHVEMFDHAVEALATPEKWDTDLNRETADHSIPYTVAVAVVDGEVTPEQYADDRLRDPAVHDLMAEITVEADPALTDHRRDQPRHIPSVTTISADGRSYVARIDAPVGHPDRPMSREQLEDKMVDNCQSLLSADQIADCIRTCRSLEDLSRVDPILDSVALGGPAGQ